LSILQRRLVRVAAAAVAVVGWGIGVANASVVNASFEDNTNLFGFDGAVTELPQTFGIWAGDVSSIVPAENSITPRTGDQMLRFDCAFVRPCEPGSLGGITADVWQLMDISAFPAGTVVETTSYFNRAPGAPPEFGGEIRIWPSLPVFSTSSQIVTPVDFVLQTFLTDADPATWEVFQMSLVLPAGVDVLGVLVQQVSLGGALGGYADDISISFDGVTAVTPIPAPGGLPLFLSALAGLGLMGWRWRQAGA